MLVTGGAVLLDSVVLTVGSGSGALAAVFVVPEAHAATNAAIASPPSDTEILFTKSSPGFAQPRGAGYALSSRWVITFSFRVVQ